MSVSGLRVAQFGVTVLSLAALIVSALPVHNASAAQITTRSLTLQAGATGDGGSLAGGNVQHLFSFTVPSSSSVGSIQFKYCTVARDDAGACTMPTGLLTTGATLTSQTGVTDFTLNNTTNGAPYITHTAGSVAGALSYQLSGIINPTAANTTFHVRISTFASNNATGVPIDTGTVSASTATQIVLSGTMPESLIFCTGATIALVAGIPNCGSATSASIKFNQLFSSTKTAVANSQMAASTNAGTGYSITVNGPTLTSGANTIDAIGATAAASTKGINQFGMNLKANTVASADAAFGSEINPSSAIVGELLGKPAAGYDTIDQFKYVSGDVIARSDFNATPKPSNAQVFTSSYIVNVKGSLPPGDYTSTLTYICTPTF